MASDSSKGSPLSRGFTFVKNKGRNALRQRPLVTSFGLVFLVYVFGLFASPSLPPQEEVVLVQSKDLPFVSLEDVVKYLRANDTRLVRPSPSDETWERQDGEACGLYLDQAYEVLAKRRGVHKEKDVVDAVRIVSLCTTNRPNHRAKLTTVAPPNVPASVVALLSSSSYVAMAAASECIWISSFSSEENHRAFVDAGAVERLSEVMTEHDCHSVKSNTERPTQCYVAQMWAAAALQNLAAAYCKTKGWGGCNWEWSGMTPDDERHKIAIETDTRVKFNPEEVRLSMIRNTKLLQTLQKTICDNIKELDKAPSERTWPSRATATDSELSASVSAWGAIGAVKNLALSPEFYELMPSDMQACLCDHAVRSPDWLEYTKAKDAIFRFGFKQRDTCDPLYDRNTCMDFKGWQDNDGANCRKYEKERWCPEYHDYVPPKEDLVPGKKYVTAGKACCACGGGKSK